MRKREFNKEFDGNFSELKKIVNSWNLIKGSSNNEFESLCYNILFELNKNSDFEKIERILESELIISYGLNLTEFDSERLSEEIIKWWKSKT